MAKRDARGRLTLEGDGTWPWLVVVVEGDDLVVENVTATTTTFDGMDDPDGNVDTASGFSTRGHPYCELCSLPQNGRGLATAGSPIPCLPWGMGPAGFRTHGTVVEVTSRATGKSTAVSLADNGPSHYCEGRELKKGIDLTKPVFILLGLDPEAGEAKVDYRIVGGAKHIG